MALRAPGFTVSSGWWVASRTAFIRWARSRLAARSAMITFPVTENSKSANP